MSNGALVVDQVPEEVYDLLELGDVDGLEELDPLVHLLQLLTDLIK